MAIMVFLAKMTPLIHDTGPKYFMWISLNITNYITRICGKCRSNYLYGKGESVDGHAGILSVKMNLTMTIKSASILDVNVFDVPVGKQNSGIQAMKPYCPFCEE